MPRIRNLVILVLLLGAIEAHCEIVRGSNVQLNRSAMTGNVELHFLVPISASEVTTFHTLNLTEPNLHVNSFSLGSDFYLFAAEEGDFVDPSNILSYPSALQSNEPNELDLNLGVSYLGFGIREPFEGSFWHSIGWLQVSRDEVGLSMLDNAVNHAGLDNFGGLGPSSGIVVGVPEPSGLRLLSLLSCIAMAMRQRNAK